MNVFILFGNGSFEIDKQRHGNRNSFDGPTHTETHTLYYSRPNGAKHRYQVFYGPYATQYKVNGIDMTESEFKQMTDALPFALAVLEKAARNKYEATPSDPMGCLAYYE